MKNDDKVKKEEEIEEKEVRTEKADEKTGDEEIEKLKQKAEECENSYKRALADYQNLQKRTSEERINWLKIANKDLLLRLLPILDTLMLAHKHTGSEEIKVGVNQFVDTLKAEGVTRIETVKKDFDPEFMEALEVVEGEDGKVLDEVRAGFMIHDKLLRAAQVKVGKGK